MGRTLLIGNPRVTWREWLKANRGKRDLLCLDPADPQQGVPGRLGLFKGEHLVATRLFGGLDPQRAPHVIVAALAEMLPALGSDGLVQLYAYRPSPLLRQVATIVLQLVRPTEILLAQGTGLELRGYPVLPTEVELDEVLPVTVQHAQRKAQWLRLIEQGEMHEVSLREVMVEGARLGSGVVLNAQERERAGIAAVAHAERCGGTLLVISPEEPTEGEIARALDITGCSRANFVETTAYDHLLCAFARPDGEEIGHGFIRSVDWASGIMQILSTAVAPSGVRILRLGALRVDPDGRELGELRPWQG
ncbi:hypothetical protein [Fimbriimonas ginsengisoli]|uniref:Uncharacterized protein n=1 Tax=Fimbriimonas ginsengisoli Gsoil 348 TaxID=661478 RepID=A0A068NL04_FIMGI|nr:hypothetical protein [Fimbriimonas ginsengisoli]AIE83460.1 hypothetical protein OP10G_0092 [Fimbriimonas ginsengisoli Gsoil 348]